MAARRLSRRTFALSLTSGLLAAGAGWRAAGAGAADGADDPATTVPGQGQGQAPVAAPAPVPVPVPVPVPAPVRIMPLGDSITLGISPDRSYRGHLQLQLRDAGHPFDFVGSYGNVIPPGGEAIWFGPEPSQTSYQGPLDIDFEGHGGFQAGQPESVVGYRDHMLAQMVPTDIPLFAPDVVLVHIGTNDLLGGWTIHGPWHGPGGPQDRPHEHAARNVLDLIDAIAALRPGVSVLVAPIGRAGLNGVQDELARVSAFIGQGVEARATAGRAVGYVADLYDELTPADLADIVHPTDAGYAKMANAWFRALHPLLCARAQGAAACAAAPVASG
ncbi:MAG: GDSL-type esterase/lipase family protein [Acidimicrobiia bacterium]